jgi:putative ABC transport system permease protein
VIDGLYEILDSITRHRLRALATAFGVFWGIFMLTLLLASGRGLRNGVDGIFAGSAISAVWLWSSRTSLPYEGMGSGRVIQLDIDDLKAIEETVSELEDVSPRRLMPGAVAPTYGSRSAGVPVHGIYPGYLRVEKAKLVRGRFLNDLDLRRARKVLVIGSGARVLLFGQGNPVGHAITLGGISFKVVGEFTDEGGEDEKRRLYIPYSTLAQTFDATRKLEVIGATVQPGVAVESVRRRVVRLLARRHHFDPADDGAIQMWFAQEEYKKLETLIRGIDIGILVVGLGTLISGMIGVSNILFVSVRERAEEFGVRRALGATANSILRFVLAEALLLATVAGGLGLAAGLALVQLAVRYELRSEYFHDPSLDPSTALIALSTLIVTALVAGYFPAREAARMQPIDALRRE